jgi:hypothetical protein
MRKPMLLALSLAVLSSGFVWAEPGGLNSINTGQNINGGTYFNTPGSRTTFENPGGGLHLQKGQLVRGLESDAARVPTGNGGTLYFRAPGNVIRLDGDIDVSAVKHGKVYVGNGGKAFFDSAYLFQSGNIYANGYNGGLVQMNVGAVTLDGKAKITAQGFGGNGGSINLHVPGAVNLAQGTLLNSSGMVSGTFDTNVISIEGGVVNVNGILRANGLALDSNPSPVDANIINAHPHLANNPTPEPIAPGAGTGQVLFGPPLEFSPSPEPATRGGTIRLVATGQTKSSSELISSSLLFVQEQKDQLLQTENTSQSRNGDVVNRGRIQANGVSKQNGGTILISAADDIVLRGSISANGKNGGTVSLSAMDRIHADATMSANGDAKRGSGGLLAFSYNRMSAKDGQIFANGLDGGLIVFSGNANPEDINLIQANGQGGRGGTIVLPQPGLLSENIQEMAQQKNNDHKKLTPANVTTTHKNEVLVNAENALLLSQAGGPGVNSTTFSGRLGDAIVRTLDHQTGLSADALQTIKHKSNIVVSASHEGDFTFDLNNANTNPIFSRPNALMVLSRGSVANNMHWSPGVSLVGPGSHDAVFALGGGHISLLSLGSITNNGFLLTRGLWAGGGINLAAMRDITNNKVILNTTFNKDLASGYVPRPGYISSHSGATILKAARDITNHYRLNTNLAFQDIHPPLNNPQLIWPLFLNDAQMGATNYLLAGRNILNSADARISADALTYRRNQVGLDNPANAIGGVITLQARTGLVVNAGEITATGRSFWGFADGRAENGPRFPSGTTFADLRSANSKSGNIIME